MTQLHKDNQTFDFRCPYCGHGQMREVALCWIKSDVHALTVKRPTSADFSGADVESTVFDPGDNAPEDWHFRCDGCNFNFGEAPFDNPTLWQPTKPQTQR